MNLFEKVFNRGNSKPQSSIIFQDFFHSFNIWNVTEKLNAYRCDENVRTVIDTRADIFSAQKIRLYKKTADGKEEIPNHPVLDLLACPSIDGTFSSDEIMAIFIKYRLLIGMSMWWVPLGKEIVPLEPQFTEPITSDGEITGFKYTKDGKVIMMDREEVVWFFTDKSLADLSQPAPLIEAVGATYDQQKEAKRWNFNFFKNNALPKKLLFWKNGFGKNKDERDNLKTEFNKKFKGTDKAHKFALASGEVGSIDLQESIKDMDFVNLLSRGDKQILKGFRTPKPLIGETDGVTVSNAQASEYIYKTNVIETDLRKFCLILSAQLLPMFGGTEGYFFHYDDPNPEKDEKKWERYEKGIEIGVFSVNEVRAFEGLEPVEGGDLPRVSASTIPINQENLSPTPTGLQLPKPKKPTQEELDAEEEKKKSKKGCCSQHRRKMSNKILQQAWEKRLTDRERKVMAMLKSQFSRQRAEVLRKIQPTKMLDIDDIFDIEGEAAKFVDEFADEFARITVDEIGIVAGELNTTASQSFVGRVTQLALLQTQNFATQINTTTWDQLRREFEISTRLGENERDTAKRVRSVFGNAENNRSRTIARTETARTSSLGRYETYRDANVDQIEWNHSPSESPRGGHIAVDGQVRELGQTFTVNGEEMLHPYDPTASAFNIINCKCVGLPANRN